MLPPPLVIFTLGLTVWTAWLTILSPHSAFSHLLAHWQIALTMVFGSIIAGGTSIGGGAVAFPVFTKLLEINPHDAKVFSLAIQSVGMSAATITICLTHIEVEWQVILWGSIGGVMGIFFGTSLLAPILPPTEILIKLASPEGNPVQTGQPLPRAG